MSINWSVRLKSKQFWIGVVGAIGTSVVAFANAFGVDIDVTTWSTVATSVVTGAFTVLALLGVVSDPTTCGVSDSAQAMTYTSPKKDVETSSTATSETEADAITADSTSVE